MVGLEGMQHLWKLAGSFKADRTFLMNGQEVGGQQRTGTVNGSVRESDGSLIFRLGNISGPPGPCNDKVIWIRWFRHGNSYDPNAGTGGGGVDRNRSAKARAL